MINQFTQKYHFKTLFAVLLCLSFSLTTSSCKEKKSKNKSSPFVSTAKIEQRDTPIYIDTIGQVISPVTVNIRPQVAGKLLDVYVQQGAMVKEGDILYTIDPRPYEAILEQAKAQLRHDIAFLEIAKQTVDRYKKVLEDDYISKLTYEQYQANQAAAQAQVEQDQAAITAAQINLDYCTIVAPVSGKISYYNVDVGNIVSIDDPNALTVIRPSNFIDILFSVSQQQFETIRKVQGDEGIWPFNAILPENPNALHEGKTFFLDNQINQNTGTILLKGRMLNEMRHLWPGEFVRVKVLHRIAPNALIVPPGAVLIGKDGPYLYTLDVNNKVANHNVTVLTRTEEYIAVESKELHVGDIVVTDGQINIAPGLEVQPKQI